MFAIFARTARNMGLYKSMNICSLVMLLLLCATFTVSTQAASINDTSLENMPDEIDNNKTKQVIQELIKIINCVRSTKVTWPVIEACVNVIKIYMPMSNFNYMDYIYPMAKGLALLDDLMKIYFPLFMPIFGSLRYLTY
ncbi:uncharacterized protein LOC116840699 isoform X2 [Odontomachus brunneus]|uniref:uncharacterized protein LOC116840699 isoform X2 n=1 Tax=Odontomachus brunneus TaxID=486640 RepID=UPI0013F1C88F|nr:uncharacterized protein LOC116840699 isoform X2 [Odontomachus brunneus]